MKKETFLDLLKMFFTWRLLLFVPLFFAFLVPFRNGFEYTTLAHFSSSSFLSHIPALSSWGNFDGVHYLNIAGHGYTTNARFMPLYPIIINFFSVLFWVKETYSLAQFLIAFFVSHIIFFLSLFFLFRLLRLDYEEKKIHTILLMFLLFPTSFFFGSIYSEGLFLLACVLSMYFARKNNWVYASLFGILGSATRIVGIILLPVLLVEFCVQKQKNIRNLFFVLLAPFGSVLYMIYNSVVWKNPLYFLRAQGELNNGRATSSFVFPLQTLYRYFKMLVTVSPSNYDWWIVLLEFVVFWFCIYLFYEMWKQKIRLSYIVFAVCGFLIPVLSGTFTGLPRYVLPLFPFFIAIAGVKNKGFKIAYGVIGVILSILLLAFFSRGYFIA